MRLEDGREVVGSHALLAVGSVPHTAGIGLEDVGVELTASGHIAVDRVSRTSVRGVYAAGDCTGVLPLASVAAMQGRIAMSHALGDAVAPLNLRVVSANIFTDPEIATVGVSQKDVDDEVVDAEVLMLPLSRNARAKMLGITDGFVKLFAQKGSGAVVGGVVVAPRASELIFPVTLAVQHRLNVDQVASTFTVYPSLVRLDRRGGPPPPRHRLTAPTGGVTVKKVRAAAVIAVVTTAVSQAREYAREHPDEAAQGLDKVEDFLRGKTAAKHAAFLDKGSAALRQGLGLPRRSAATRRRCRGHPRRRSGLTDPDPDTTEPPATYGFRDPVAPNPSPGTSDDPQPRRWDDDPAPLTPGERPRH